MKLKEAVSYVVAYDMESQASTPQFFTEKILWVESGRCTIIDIPLPMAKDIDVAMEHASNIWGIAKGDIYVSVSK